MTYRVPRARVSLMVYKVKTLVRRSGSDNIVGILLLLLDIILLFDSRIGQRGVALVASARPRFTSLCVVVL